MKKIATAFILVFFLCTLMAIAVSADTVEISTPEQLMAISGDGSYKLACNIDMSGVDHTPIGTAEAPFSGEFDGNGKIISGLSFDEAEKYVGLFGVCENATVKNLVIKDISVNITDSKLDEVYVSGICAYAIGSCSFESCKVYGIIYVKSKANVYAAGICAYVESGLNRTLSSFTSCVNNAPVSVESTGDKAKACAAGIAANGLFADVLLSANNGDIKVVSKCGAVAAGISATYGQRDIKKTYNTANISAESKTTDAIASGLIATSIYGIIEDAFNSGDILAHSLTNAIAGGICAESQMENEYRRSYNAGTVTVNGTGTLGSLVSTASVRDKYSSNYVLESEAPIIGKNSKDGAATSLTEAQMITAESFTGFDFNNVWYMPDSGDYVYPMLRGFEVVEEDEDVILGDFDGDESINSLDLIILSRYLAGFIGYDDFVTVGNGDLDGDGDVTPLDVVVMARHIADWQGYETIPLA